VQKIARENIRKGGGKKKTRNRTVFRWGSDVSRSVDGPKDGERSGQHEEEEVCVGDPDGSSDAENLKGDVRKKRTGNSHLQLLLEGVKSRQCQLLEIIEKSTATDHGPEGSLPSIRRMIKRTL